MKRVARGEEVLAPSPLQVHQEDLRVLIIIRHPGKRATLSVRQILTAIRNKNRQKQTPSHLQSHPQSSTVLSTYVDFKCVTMNINGFSEEK